MQTPGRPQETVWFGPHSVGWGTAEAMKTKCGLRAIIFRGLLPSTGGETAGEADDRSTQGVDVAGVLLRHC